MPLLSVDLTDFAQSTRPVRPLEGKGFHPGRRYSLHLRRIITTVFAFAGLGVCCLLLLSGCGDETRTTGTQVQMSDEAKAQIKDMRDMYKEGVRKDEDKGSGRRRK
jgi:hypothetical protein